MQQQLKLYMSHKKQAGLFEAPRRQTVDLANHGCNRSSLAPTGLSFEPASPKVLTFQSPIIIGGTVRGLPNFWQHEPHAPCLFPQSFCLVAEFLCLPVGLPGYKITRSCKLYIYIYCSMHVYSTVYGSPLLNARHFLFIVRSPQRNPKRQKNTHHELFE